MRWSCDGAWQEFWARENGGQFVVDDATGMKVAAFAWAQLQSPNPKYSGFRCMYVGRFGTPDAAMEAYIRRMIASDGRFTVQACLGGMKGARLHPEWCELVSRIAVDRTIANPDRFVLIAELVHCKECRENGVAAQVLHQCEGETDPDMHVLIESGLHRIERLNRP
jgi:hypothetical protein